MDIKYDDYSAYVSGNVDLTEIGNAVYKPGRQWKMSNEEACSVNASILTKDAKNWHYFVGARFMLSSHLNDVTKDRAILIYCILSASPLTSGVSFMLPLFIVSEVCLWGSTFPLSSLHYVGKLELSGCRMRK